MNTIRPARCILISVFLLAVTLPASAKPPVPVISLSAETLPDGPVATWKNTGSAGGAFTAVSTLDAIDAVAKAAGIDPKMAIDPKDNRNKKYRTRTAEQNAPKTAVIDGVCCVDFRGEKWLLTNFVTPKSLTGNRPVTILAKVWRENIPAKSTVLTLAARPTHCFEMGFGRGSEGAFTSWGRGNSGYITKPVNGKWTDIALRFTPGEGMSFFVNGKLDWTVKKIKELKTKSGHPIILGGSWFAGVDKKRNIQLNFPEFEFNGAIASVKIYDAALTTQQIRQAGGRYDCFDYKPANGAIVQERDVTLSWQLGDERVLGVKLIVAHMPFGKSTARKELLLNKTLDASVTEYKLEGLTLGDSYLWYVLQATPGGESAEKYRGTIQKFTVSTGPATNPTPANRTANTPVASRQLRWTPGRYAVKQELYIGLSPDAVTKATKPVATFNGKTDRCPIPLKLTPGTRYYWQIRHDNGKLPSGDGRGPLWAFRTQDAPIKNNVTFFVGTDPHYKADEVNVKTKANIAFMNWLPGSPWPDQAKLGTVRTPRGLLMCGDLTDRADKPCWDEFCRDFGEAGQGVCGYPVYEAFGNHDGRTGSVVRLGIAKRNPTRTGVDHISDNGLHYALDWQHVRVICTNLFPGHDSKDVKLGPANHDPQESIDFLKKDLEQNVGNSGRPVVIFQHYGWDDFSKGWGWWTDEARTRLADVVKDYNVVMIFNGHNHGYSFIQWEGIPVCSSSALDKSFLGVNITKNKLTVALFGTKAKPHDRVYIRKISSEGNPLKLPPETKKKK